MQDKLLWSRYNNEHLIEVIEAKKREEHIKHAPISDGRKKTYIQNRGIRVLSELNLTNCEAIENNSFNTAGILSGNFTNCQ